MADATDTPSAPAAQQQPEAGHPADASGASRRQLLGRAAVAAAAAFPGAFAAELDPHVAWKRQEEALRAAHDDDGDEVWRLHDLIAETPARTLDGIAVQVRLAVECSEDGSMLGDCEQLALRNALGALNRMTQEARA